jgi:hypothetical protein
MLFHRPLCEEESNRSIKSGPEIVNVLSQFCVLGGDLQDLPISKGATSFDAIMRFISSFHSVDFSLILRGSRWNFLDAFYREIRNAGKCKRFLFAVTKSRPLCLIESGEGST